MQVRVRVAARVLLRAKDVLDDLHRQAVEAVFDEGCIIAGGSSMPVGYLHVDMDHLKAINDASHRVIYAPHVYTDVFAHGAIAA